jgi:hypothetical protein
MALDEGMMILFLLFYLAIKKVIMSSCSEGSRRRFQIAGLKSSPGFADHMGWALPSRHLHERIQVLHS